MYAGLSAFFIDCAVVLTVHASHAVYREDIIRFVELPSGLLAQEGLVIPYLLEVREPELLRVQGGLLVL